MLEHMSDKSRLYGILAISSAIIILITAVCITGGLYLAISLVKHYWNIF